MRSKAMKKSVREREREPIAGLRTCYNSLIASPLPKKQCWVYFKKTNYIHIYLYFFIKIFKNIIVSTTCCVLIKIE